MIVIAGETANTPFKRTHSLEELISAGAFVAGPSRTRLQNLGLDLTKVRSLNLCSPGRWDPNEACMNARRLVSLLTNELATCDECTITHILAMGQRVSFAFGLPFEPLEFKSLWSAPKAAVIAISCPHPSGLSRWWNNPDNVFKFKEMVYGCAPASQER